MNTYNNFTELAKANGTAVYESPIGLNATFNTLHQANAELADDNTVDTANIAMPNLLKDDISEALVLWNMSVVGHLRNGYGLCIFPRDHGIPHIDVMRGKQKMAKIFMEPKIELDPATPCKLTGDERKEAFADITKNLIKYKKEWNRIHEHNPAAQKATIPGESNVTQKTKTAQPAQAKKNPQVP